ncbi:LysR substrate-binding domain-containing protein [Burkholderia sp. Ac-20353]|uniref:LysR substrate-binding domain-containing protein n=1 Tax=Burkholderia sp. Ac-20353 TaxID=2703894 RepID=UPI00197BD05D|nr:LysR substrate-binding domain-containing protein [Burkholderia sp. Ac-20353]MBN3786421.1 LysR family transcriptional regulator [Burkholderia sp. Ac-20353]
MINIPTELLRTFVKAVDMGSFTRAGEVVGRTQSAISLQIQRLEKTLDAQLFVRGTHRVRLTEEGEALIEYARRMLALNDEAVSSLRKPQVAGAVRLGAPHEYEASLLQVILGKFAQSHPGVMLEVTCDLSKNLLERLAKSEFDLVMALHDDPHDSTGVRVRTEPLVWVTGPDHGRHEQRPLPLVVAQQPCIYRNRALQTLNRLEVPWRIAYTSSSYSGITAAVRAGLGVTVLAGSTVPDGVRALEARDGLPEMGHLDVRLHSVPERMTEAVRRLEDYIATSLLHEERG